MRVRHIAVLLLIVFTVFGCTNGGNEEHTSSLSSLKDNFEERFMLGNIFNPSDVSSSGVTNTMLTRHYNVLTAENNMKPDQISTGKGSYNFTTADIMVNAARASGFKVVGHTLLWHSQIPQWQQSISSSTALADMKQYITDVMVHFRGKIYSWDVLNEVFPDGVSASADWKTAMRTNNPWFKTIGSDFVYEGYKAARLADPDAILYYNDYNMDNTGKATMVRNMVRDVNEQWKNDSQNKDKNRFLIEGIGMQSHHNTGVSASAIENTLNLFKPLGVKISVSELDVLIVTYQEFAPYGHGTNKQNSITGDKKTSGLKKQAELYEHYFKVYLEFSDIIERVTFWGVTDDKSWRSAGLPLLFDSNGNPKDAYYSVMGSLE
jgi:endo-1,4-beta-xylanase